APTCPAPSRGLAEAPSEERLQPVLLPHRRLVVVVRVRLARLRPGAGLRRLTLAAQSLPAGVFERDHEIQVHGRPFRCPRPSPSGAGSKDEDGKRSRGPPPRRRPGAIATGARTDGANGTTAPACAAQ